MNDLDKSGLPRPEAPLNRDDTPLLDEKQEEVTGAASRPSHRRNPRMFIRTSVIKSLVSRGIPDDPTSLTKVINDILEYAIAASQTEITHMGDLVAIEQGLADRIEELTAANMGVAKLLYDIAAVAEVDQTYSSLREIAKSRVPSGASKAVSATSIAPSTPSTPAKS